jgi:hypothetical protein
MFTYLPFATTNKLLSHYKTFNGGRDSAVGIATTYKLDCERYSQGRGKIFLLSTSSRQIPGSTQPTIQWVPGAFAPGVERLERESYHSSPTSAEPKNAWI